MQIKNFKITKGLKELTEHRTVELPLACYETKIRHNSMGYIPLHWHEEVQFVWIFRGEAIFQIDEDKVALCEGDGLFINSGCLHMAEEKEQTDCVYICLNVSPRFLLPQELFKKYVVPYIQATNLPYVFIDANEAWGKYLIEAILKIKQLIEKKPDFFEIGITMQLTAIWKNLIFNALPPTYIHTEMLKSHRMKQMLSWIHLNYAEKVLLEDIAKAGELSRAECCRYFKRILKTSPLNYVKDYRIQRSLVLLQQEEFSITDVGYKVGFNSTSYFIENFRRSLKMTPLAYKKSLAEKLAKETEHTFRPN
ncbi:AraC family transcriptional regulator [Aciduricibacillus chroicocephali]|uniref:AraC family transcriptional regulator n=1 Tax=Aciduricibacillus chroicocephali TaxID=3054939 RepID=A0ABY9KYW2_9BACI|nr:AraC family transcriptional regulator [Bacillaceae bacterium 44XB]